VEWRKLAFLQAETFKNLNDESKAKLKASVISNDFSQPFYVWQDCDGTIYCLDGKHRSLILEELIADGVEVPEELPATFMRCSGRKDAAELVLQYSSIYARITQQGLFDFLEAFELDFDQARQKIDLPDFSMPRFEQKSGIFDVNDAEEPDVDVPEAAVIVQPGDIFELNGHRIICGSFRDDEAVASLMQGDIARIVNCDPPYNLPANFFTNKDEKRHNDFAMAAGEMTDEEFVQFLALIMQRSVENTVPGAIHYIFMDFRHCWHMTEAGRRVYGTTQPKQVCTWVKDIMANGSFYRAQQELCFVFSNEQAKALWHRDLVDEGGFYKSENELCFIFKNGDAAKHLSHLDMKHRIRTNVWRYPSAISLSNPDRHELKNHPTPKPVAMIADAILDTTNADDVVIDWFLGSGTCLIACEHTGRRGRFTEIEPKYVQGAILRYIAFCEKRGMEVNFRHLNGNLTIDQLIHEPETVN
jgi:DNA modification methylase